MSKTVVIHTEPGLTLGDHGGQMRVVSTTAFAIGDVVLAVDGPVARQPDRHTLQVGLDEHADTLVERGGRSGYLMWRWLDHSCQPNTRLVGRKMVATRAIAPGDTVTFDYETTEWDMASPFDCRCGAAGCRRHIRGYRHLTEATRSRLHGVAPHLLALVDAPGLAAR